MHNTKILKANRKQRNSNEISSELYKTYISSAFIIMTPGKIVNEITAFYHLYRFTCYDQSFATDRFVKRECTRFFTRKFYGSNIMYTMNASIEKHMNAMSTKKSTK